MKTTEFYTEAFNKYTTLYKEGLNIPTGIGQLSEKNVNDLIIYNAMLEEWANGLLSLRIDPKDCNIKNINKIKKRFYWIHWKRGTKGIKHYANMILDRLTREQREAAKGKKIKTMASDFTIKVSESGEVKND